MYDSLDTKPNYLRRALNPKTEATRNNETVKLAQSDNIVYPTIRLLSPGKGGTGNRRLKKYSMKEAEQLARNKKDFIRFQSEKDARYFAENFTKLIDKKRKSNGP
jgi:hypothetical protein